jgi:RNA polymerase primary sigma factor
MKETTSMNPDRPLEVDPGFEPAHRDQNDQEAPQCSSGDGPDQGYRHRFVKRAWARRRGTSSLRLGVATQRRLSKKEERALATRIRVGDSEALEQLIMANLPLVFRAVSEYKEFGACLEDLIQEGNLGLVRAARDFDPKTHTTRFATYATYWIRCFIVRALASNGSAWQLPGNLHRLGQRYLQAVDELRAAGATAGDEFDAQSPSLEEIAAYLKVSPSRLERARRSLGEQRASIRIGELMPAGSPTPEHHVFLNEDRSLVYAALERLHPFEAWVICERFGLTLPASDRRRTWGTTHRREPARKLADEQISTPRLGGKPAEGSCLTESYFHRSYFAMGRDCGLSVHRLRQVEKTALDKLRSLLDPQSLETTLGLS